MMLKKVPRKQVPLIRELGAAGEQVGVGAVFRAGLKEARTFLDLKVISPRQHAEYNDFLNKLYAKHLNALRHGDSGQVKQFFDALMRYKHEQLSIATNTTVEKTLASSIENRTLSRQNATVQRRKKVKVRPGIQNKGDYLKALTARKRDLLDSRLYRRVVNGESINEIAHQTGIKAVTVKKYVGREAEKKGVDLEQLLKSVSGKTGVGGSGKGKPVVKPQSVSKESVKLPARKDLPEKEVFAVPTEAGSILASREAIKLSQKIDAIKRQFSNSVVGQINARARIKELNLETKRDTLKAYVDGRLSADHPAAIFLAGLKLKSQK